MSEDAALSLPGMADIPYDCVVIHELDGEFHPASLCKAMCAPEAAREAVRLLSELREAEQSRCHFPGYRIELLQAETVVFGTSICWQCDNMRLDGPLAPSRGWAVFDSGSDPAQALLALCQQTIEGLGDRPSSTG
ncbi:hypothetical protein ABI_11940 [Asticcacaulis biprosthecium C19]|uniref:Uncharacterized protein n=1 Tax=Asticcacaulis biprosthecium C19 TaxID=715226 RepID=F4QHM0_9CAUL|nr:hypothetical protein [Asticcacaulis biprosthecium]EGF92757.1 hypothetical protein ABI_11940 [Asticcacaulis biprosthecium C19]